MNFFKYYKYLKYFFKITIKYTFTHLSWNLIWFNEKVGMRIPTVGKEKWKFKKERQKCGGPSIIQARKEKTKTNK